MKSRTFLIPRIRVNEKARVADFSRHFSEIELDLWGLGRTIGPKDADEVVGMSRSARLHGMRIHSVHLRGGDISSASKKSATEAIASIKKLQNALSPSIAVIHPGYGTLDDLVSNTGFVSERMPPGITLVVENLSSPNSPLSSSEDVHDFVREISAHPPNIGVCVDITHPHPEPGRDYTDIVLSLMEAALPRLLHLHVSDRKGAKGKHAVIGEGIVDWARIKGFLDMHGYAGKGVLEINGGSDIVESAKESARRYYGTIPKILNHGAQISAMARDTASRDEILDMAKKSYGMPESVADLLELPGETVVESGGNFTYFVVHSKKSGKGHEDPFYSLTGGNGNLGWADYLFGFREDAGKLHVLLIDKGRRIALEERILNIYSGEGKHDWERVENAIKRSIGALSTYKTANHIEFTFGQPEAIPEGDSRAW